MADTEVEARGSVQYRVPCGECQRRKQKCNREWPCNHCQKRKVADQCRFARPQQSDPSPPDADKVSPLRPDGDAEGSAAADASGATDPLTIVAGDDEEDGDGADLSHDVLGVESLGFLTAPMLARYGIKVETKRLPAQEEDWLDPESCPQLQHALDILPKRTQMDALVQSFFNNVNLHYYIIYPPTFLQEYQTWWETRSQRKALSVQWTALLTIICACATQHLDVQTKSSVEVDLGGKADDLSEQYFDASRELAGVIPFGRYHLLNVQRMLHAIYWFKAEAKFAEAWDLIHSAVQESQELGLHKESASGPLPEFEREMRRRAWCILDSWDWQFASGLGRPTFIDHQDVDVKLPTLALEDFTPSPLLHMKLQSELIRDLAVRYAVPKNITAPADIQEYKGMIETWMHKFPAVYDVDNPDKSKDKAHTWITFHRFYIHTMAYLMILNPMRVWMAKTYDASSPADELQIRTDGVNYSLRNLKCTTAWVHHVSHRDGRFHFIIFSLFDTAAVLSTAIFKDKNQTIPRRDEILAAIRDALMMLKRLNTISSSAKTSYEILARMVKKLPRTKARKKARIEKTPPAPIPEPSPEKVDQPVFAEPSTEQADQAAFPESNQVPPAGSDSTSPGSLLSIRSVTAGSTPSNLAESAGYLTGSASESAPPSTDGQLGALGATSSLAADDVLALEAMADPALFTDLRPENPDVINGAVMGAFSDTWDWRSLELDFIVSEMPGPENVE